MGTRGLVHYRSTVHYASLSLTDDRAADQTGRARLPIFKEAVDGLPWERACHTAPRKLLSLPSPP